MSINPFYLHGEELSPVRKLLFMKALAGGAPLSEYDATGNPLTFTTNVAKPLKSLVASFLPVQSGTGDPSPENVRPISGMTGLTVYHSGADTSDPETYSVTFPALGKNLLPTSGWSSSSYASYYRIPGDFLGTLTIDERDSSISLSGINFGVTLYEPTSAQEAGKGYNWIISNGTLSVRRTNKANYPASLDANCMYFAIYPNTQEAFEKVFAKYNIMFAEGTTAQPYEPFTNTIYGGSLDLVTGVLTAEYAYADLGNYRWANEGNGLVRTGGFGSEPGKIKYRGGLYCSAYKPVKKGYATIDYGEISTDNGAESPFIRVKNADFTDMTGEEVKTALTGVMIAYELATPITYQLTPQQVTALIGDNTIWSDANGNCEVTYLKKG